MLSVPLFEVLLTQSLRERKRVIAGRHVDARLRHQRQTVLAYFQISFRALEADDLRAFRPEIQPGVDRNLSVLEEGSVYVGHIAPVFPAQDAAHGHGALGGL